MPIDTGDTAWVLVASAFVMLMIPALGFFEAGLVRVKNVLSVIMQCFTGLALLSILWFLIGFSLTFGPDIGGWIGSLDWALMNGVPLDKPLEQYAPTIPGASFASFQMMFAVITPLLITGAFAERLKWSAFFVFMIAWSIFIYYPVAHWVWGDGGWLRNIGVADFAGGIVIHEAAGLASLAAALVLGRRKGFGPRIVVPNNIPLAIIGASLLWMGWFGFNAGSALASGSLSANTFLVTHIASAASCLVWVCISWARTGKPGTTDAITGAIAGLAGITPASGFVSVQYAFIIGLAVGFASYYGRVLIKDRARIDDALDVTPVHGISGILGAIVIGFFASQVINPAGPNGWLFGSPAQLGIQAFGVGVVALMGFGGTLIIMKIIDVTMGLKVKEVKEDLGLDITEHGERGYSI